MPPLDVRSRGIMVSPPFDKGGLVRLRRIKGGSVFVLHDRIKNCAYTFKSLHDFFICKSDNLESIRLQYLCSFAVIFFAI